MMNNVLRARDLQIAQNGKTSHGSFSNDQYGAYDDLFSSELGEPGNEDLGFGDPTRTSIFDYGSVPSVVRWVNDKKYDGGQSTKEELALRDFYKRLLHLTLESPAMMGAYQDLHIYNREITDGYGDKLLSFARWSDDQKLIVISNFSAEKSYELDYQIPSDLIKAWELEDGSYTLKDALYNKVKTELVVKDGKGIMKVELGILESFVFEVF